MLTCDNNGSAKTVVSIIGIDEYYSNLMPEDKVKLLNYIMEKYGHVSMVGDGINYAPPLGRASTGIAMGAAGSDVAIETANIAFDARLHI